MDEAYINNTAEIKPSNVDTSELDPRSKCIDDIQGNNRASEIFGKHDENCTEDEKEREGDSSRAPLEDIHK